MPIFLFASEIELNKIEIVCTQPQDIVQNDTLFLPVNELPQSDKEEFTLKDTYTFYLTINVDLSNK